MRVPSDRVVELVDVLTERGRGLSARLVPDVVEQFGAERGEEALGDGVVPAITFCDSC